VHQKWSTVYVILCYHSFQGDKLKGIFNKNMKIIVLIMMMMMIKMLLEHCVCGHLPPLLSGRHAQG
jgi:hypothetical protein